MLKLAVAVLLHLATASHVDVRLPYLNSAGVTYYQGPHGAQSAYAQGPEFAQPAYSSQHQVAYAPQQVVYDSHGYNEHEVAYQQQAYVSGPAAVGYAQVPVKTAVAVPTVKHVPAVADVPVTKIEAHPAVIQKLVDVAKPAIKTQKYEIRRPAIQKQFYDIEERIIVRPVGSALVELDEPLSKHEKGPAFVQSVDDHHHEKLAIAADHGVALASSPIHHAVAVTPASLTVAITPSIHNTAYSTVEPHHQYPHGYEHEQTFSQYLHNEPLSYHGKVIVSSTPAPIHYSTPGPVIVSSTIAPLHGSEDSIYVDAAARKLAHAEHAAFEASAAHQEAIVRAHQHEADKAEYIAQVHAHEEAIARENYKAEVIAHRQAAANAKYHAHANAHLAVEAHSNGAPYEHVVVKNAPVNIKNLNHLSHEEAQDNQHKLLQLLTARGGVAEVGFGRSGHSEHVGDAGISRARVLSATPSPHHGPIEEKVNTRRIVVSRPVQTLQEIDVVQPATKVETVAINEPTVIKTAKLGYERIQTSVPVYGKALAPAIATAQVPVEYYH